MVATSGVKLKYLLLIAAALHLMATSTVYLVGRFELLPGLFDTHGIGASFAADSLTYRKEISDLADGYHRGGLSGWLDTPARFSHTRLYSLFFVLLGPLVGYNVLAAEPLNLVLYLGIVALVFGLGREVFDRRVGLVAAAGVGLWPSFVLHTTQLLRDPLFIFGMLGLMVVLTSLLTRTYAWRGWLAACGAGGAMSALIWTVKSSVFELILATVLIATGLLLMKQLLERRVLPWNMACAVLLLAVVVNIGQVLAPETSEVPEGAGHGSQPPAAADQPVASLQGLVTRIDAMRYGFTTTDPNAGSNIDTDVRFRDVEDLAGYVPRAVEIGLFAPFPGSWISESARVGLTGRLLAGLETLVMYVVEALALLGLWWSRDRLAAWLLLLTVLMGTTAFGLVVNNLGTLYRFRYAFWMLLIVLGAAGASRLCLALSPKKTTEIEDRTTSA